MSEVLRTLLLRIEYDGTRYHGWQRQDDVPTVQQTVEEALAFVLNGPVTVVGSSRTDAGVHARGHASSLVTTRTVDCRGIRLGANAKLPDDIAIVDVEERAAGFNARFDAKSKLYRYSIWNSPKRSPLRDRCSAFAHRPADPAWMHAGAQFLVGTHDFFSLATHAAEKETTVRTIFRCDVARRASDPDMIDIEVEGDGFLYNQVRTIAGTLLEVGFGRRTPGSVERLLETRDRRLAGPNLPARGLTLVSVRY